MGQISAGRSSPIFFNTQDVNKLIRKVTCDQEIFSALSFTLRLYVLKITPDTIPQRDDIRKENVRSAKNWPDRRLSRRCKVYCVNIKIERKTDPCG